jgi:hypothetical protein
MCGLLHLPSLFVLGAEPGAGRLEVEKEAVGDETEEKACRNG